MVEGIKRGGRGLEGGEVYGKYGTKKGENDTGWICRPGRKHPLQRGQLLKTTMREGAAERWGTFKG